MKQKLKAFGTAVKSGAAHMIGGMGQKWYYFLVIAAVIGLDRLTKALAVKFLEPIDTFPLWRGVLHLTYLENRGAAFGMLSDRRAVFMIVSTVGILVFLWYLFAKREKNLLFDLGLTFVIGGGIGNMIDRVALGYVVDFIDFRLINFAVFNGADSFVCVGAGMMLLSLLMQIIREGKSGKNGQGQTAEKSAQSGAETPHGGSDGDDKPSEGGQGS